MRRVGHLFEEATSFASLLQAARRAMRGSGHGKGAGAFFFALEPEVLELRRSLIDGDYLPGPLRSFVLSGPKKRLIAVAPFRDRVVHHAVVGVLEPLYERSFIADSYATRKGKGTHRAVRRAQEYLRRHRWYLKTDVESYFATVDQEILLETLARKARDRRLLDLLGLIVENGGEQGKGLPIGNLTSQFLANVYLDVLDHFVKEELRAGCYIRYMDDIVVLGDDRSGLKAILGEIAGFLHERPALRLKESATFINQRLNGLPFLGTRVFPGMVRIRRENRRRALRRLVLQSRRLERGLVAEQRYLRCAASTLGYLRSFGPSGRTGIYQGKRS